MIDAIQEARNSTRNSTSNADVSFLFKSVRASAHAYISLRALKSFSPAKDSQVVTKITSTRKTVRTDIKIPSFFEQYADMWTLVAHGFVDEATANLVQQSHIKPNDLSNRLTLQRAFLHNLDVLF